jgi:serine/threonine-protein kinase RsbW
VVLFAKKNDFDSQRIWEIDLLVDETFSNIIDYAYPQEKGDIEVCCRFQGDKDLFIGVHDRRIPFKPLSHPRPNILADIQNLRTKGYGIFLVRSLIDRINYKREEDHNCLTLEIRPRISNDPDARASDNPNPGPHFWTSSGGEDPPHPARGVAKPQHKMRR